MNHVNVFYEFWAKTAEIGPIDKPKSMGLGAPIDWYSFHFLCL